jgi:hypothetical protein
VLKALALGACAESVLDLLRGGLDAGLMAPAKSSITELTPEDLVIPPGFARTLGAPRP